MARPTTSRAKPAQRSSKRNRSVWADDTLVDNPEAPAARKHANRQKWMRRALYLSAFAAIPVATLASFAAVANSTGQEPLDFADGSVITNDSRGKFEAYRQLEEWLGTTPAPLPDARIVSWDGYEVEEPPAPEPGKEQQAPTYTYEQHRFTLQRGTSFYTATVEVAVDDVVGAVATAEPSVMPVARVDTIDGLTTWFNLPTETVPEPAVAAVKTWAQAFVSGDANALHQAIQDQDTTRSYLPLKGVQELVSLNVVDAARHPSDESEGVASTLIARVQLRLWWTGGKPTVGPNEQMPEPTPVTYDILIRNADTATPVVVAWGAPGSGPDLSPYSNALPVVLQPSTTGQESTAPDGTTTEGTAPVPGATTAPVTDQVEVSNGTDQPMEGDISIDDRPSTEGEG